jgi:hypothetical protein
VAENNLPLIFRVDTNSIASEFGELKEQVKVALTKGVETLAIMTNAKAHELAAEQLHTTSKKYRDALSFDNPAEGVWVVSLKEEMLWREENMSPHSMVDDLLKKNYKVNSKGEKFKIIPFHHGGGQTQNTPKQMNLLGILKDFLKQNQINYKKIETGSDGKPLIGKLHTLNVPSPLPSKMAKFPAFSGVNIYQNMNSRGKVQRDIVTFRIVKESHKNEGRWFHPGMKGAKILDQALVWAQSHFETEILPTILESFDKR